MLNQIKDKATINQRQQIVQEKPKTGVQILDEVEVLVLAHNLGHGGSEKRS